MWPFGKESHRIISGDNKINYKDEPKTADIPQPSQITKRKKLKIEIKIRTRGDLMFSYNQIHELDSGKTPLGCFIDFYLWFYQRSSPAFTFWHKNGGDIIIRSEITSISLSKTEIEEEV